ncbi:MAG TPA: LuxR C-terminal-related transcriptional regulator, partial [Thermomicrobiales bacterium]|nr:LuxR C-terminal-related transcriptional regulator [Thermomicrobiales bacterium]
LLGGEGARELIDEGREMSPEDAIEAARELTLGTRASDNDTGLTGRELDVLDLLVVGKSDRDIGESLSISYRTVQTHTRRIFRKLGVHSRTEAIAEAHRRGIA